MNDLIERIVQLLLQSGVVINLAPINVTVNVNQPATISEGKPILWNGDGDDDDGGELCDCAECTGHGQPSGDNYCNCYLCTEIRLNAFREQMQLFGEEDRCKITGSEGCSVCWPEQTQEQLSREEAEDLPTPEQVLELFGGSAVGRIGSDETMTAADLAEILGVWLAPPAELPAEEEFDDEPHELPSWAEPAPSLQTQDFLPLPATSADASGVIHFTAEQDPGFFVL